MEDIQDIVRQINVSFDKVSKRIKKLEDLRYIDVDGAVNEQLLFIVNREEKKLVSVIKDFKILNMGFFIAFDYDCGEYCVVDRQTGVRTGISSSDIVKCIRLAKEKINKVGVRKYRKICKKYPVINSQ